MDIMQRSIIYFLTWLLLVLIYTFTCPIVQADNSQLNKAIEIFQKADYTKAIEAFDKVLIKEPNNYSAHLYKAVALNYLGKIDDAESEYKWLVLNSPNQETKLQAKHALTAIEEIKKQKSMYQMNTPANDSNLGANKSSSQVVPALTNPQVYCFIDNLDVNCKTAINFIKEMNQFYANDIDFKLIDISNTQSADLTSKFQIRGVVPTIILINKLGQIVEKSVTDINYNELKVKINMLTTN